MLETQILYIFLLHSAEVGTKIIDQLISCVFFETFSCRKLAFISVKPMIYR